MRPPKAFLETLQASGADTDVVIFFRKLAPATYAYLAERGVTLIPFRMWKRWNGPIHTWRFVLFARYAAEHYKEYDWIMTADLRDVIFQSDPFAGLSDRQVQFYLENAAYTLGSDQYYSRWMRRFIDPSLHAEYGRHRLACCGVILGGAPEMAAYLGALAPRLRSVSLLNRPHIGADSAFQNLIAHVTHDVPGSLVENNIHVATMGLEPPGTYHIDPAGNVACADGHRPPILHQYDRLPALIAASRYGRLSA